MIAYTLVNIDFGEQLAPNVAASSARLLTAMACELDNQCHYAFRFRVAVPECREKTVKLNKSSYYFKQASKEWHAHLTTALGTFAAPG